MARKPYKRYSKEFKIEPVRLADESDKPVTQVARELGIRQNQIYKWKKQLEIHGETAFPGTGKPVDNHCETARLRKELAAAREEIEILKKAAAYFARDVR
ncbi:MAG: transposase [Proteobacteria bacterium]|nr:transposase [Pseudomonadota bacterium]